MCCFLRHIRSAGNKAKKLASFFMRLTIYCNWQETMSDFGIYKFKKKFLQIFAGTFISLFVFSPLVWADDTEVFFGDVNSGSETFPNLLFIFDTSSNMGSKGSHGVSRLNRLKEAMGTILDEVTNVNMGFMGWNGQGYGGSVHYPIKNVDSFQCVGDNCSDVTVSGTMQTSTDDAYEKFDSSQEVITDSTALPVASWVPLQTTAIGFTGLRFNDLQVPAGATITSAYIEFVADGISESDSNVWLIREDTDNAEPFQSTAGSLTSRFDFSLEAVQWEPDPWLVAEEKHVTSDLSSLVQKVTDLPDWCGGNSIAFGMVGIGERLAAAYDQNPFLAPVLKVTYDPSTIPPNGGCRTQSVISSIASGNNDAQERISRNSVDTGASTLPVPMSDGTQYLTGLRFENLAIPKDAEITDARLQFVASAAAATPALISVAAENVSDSAPFSTRKRNLSNRGKTSGVLWDLSAPTSAQDRLESPDLSSIVSGIVSQAGWSAGNAISLLVENGGGSNGREVFAYEDAPANAARLKVSYKVYGSTGGQTSTVRDSLREAVLALDLHPGTPVIDSYAEAAFYYTGRPVLYGRTRGAQNARNSVHRVSHPESYSGGQVFREPGCTDANLNAADCVSEEIMGDAVYDSPILDSCQTSHIVLLATGGPNRNTAVDEIMAMTGDTSCVAGGTEACGIELASWLSGTDHKPGLPGKQNINTYTIGFSYHGTILQDLATAGNGKLFEAESAADLVDVFRTIIDEVRDIETSFVSPGTTVNQFNRLTHRDDIYFSLFKPNKNPHWSGNLKKYKVGKIDDKIRVIDASSPPKMAVDEASGFFSEDSRSYWSTVTDGNFVELGGAASKLPFITRKLYTNTDYNFPIDLTLGKHQFSENNTAISKTMLGIADRDNNYKSTVMRWARGVDLKDFDLDGDTEDMRPQIGDPMHAKPLIVNYGDVGAYDSLVYVATNEGFIHAIDTETGAEKFAFMPQELLKNLPEQYEDSSAQPHLYGLDGSLSLWVQDKNNDNAVNFADGEKAILYFGMRRGGNSYFALDISDYNNPKFLWKIEGGPGGTEGFEELGQSWSKPSYANIKINGVLRDVLIFGAGYDTSQDTKVTRSADSIGRGIFIIDAENGSLLWSISGENSSRSAHTHVPAMQYAIPSDIRIVDIDLDGLADQLYVGDLGGQLWRFDVNSMIESEPLIDGGVIADFSGNDADNNRRFYYEPDVSLVSHGGVRQLAIAIGSGWRAHPLDLEVEDRFYVLKSDDIFSAPVGGYGKPSSDGLSFSPYTENDLLDITNNLSPSDSEIASHNGWMLQLQETGEKVLGGAMTVNNQVVFTTYRPDQSSHACETAVGGGAVYAMEVRSGRPTIDLAGDGILQVSNEDRSVKLNHGGIPPEPSSLFTEDGPIVLVGPEQPLDELMFGDLTQKTYWIEKAEAE